MGSDVIEGEVTGRERQRQRERSYVGKRERGQRQ
jgi:hypothetical protein